MRDQRLERIEEVYGSRLTAIGRNSMRAGFVILFFALLMWVFWFAVIREQANAREQLAGPIGATLFGLAFLIGWPLYRIGWRASVAPRVRAFLDGKRVEGTIESVETTNVLFGRSRYGQWPDTDANTHAVRVVCRYSVDGRTYHSTSVPFPRSLLGGRAAGDSLPLYVVPFDPSRAEVDIFGIRER